MRFPAALNLRSTDSLRGLRLSCDAVVSRQETPRKSCGPDHREIRQASALLGVWDFPALPDAERAAASDRTIPARPASGEPIGLSASASIPEHVIKLRRIE